MATTSAGSPTSDNSAIFFLYDQSGAPLSGANPGWSYLRDHLGNDYNPKPQISAVTGAPGAYKFTRPNELERHLVGMIDAGTNNAVVRYRPFIQRGEQLRDVITLLDDLVPNDLDAILRRIVGLMHENSVLDQTTHDSSNNLTAGRLRLYNSKANADAAALGGSGTSGLVASYAISATYVGGNLSTYKVTKDP